MKAVKELKNQLELENANKNKVKDNITQLENDIKAKLSEMAETQNKNIDGALVLAEIKKLKEQKQDEKIKLEAIESNETDHKALAEKSKQDYLSEVEEYKKEIAKSWARAKQKKEEFNIFIEKEKEIRNQLNSKVSIKRNETEKVIRGIISIKQIKYPPSVNFIDLKRLKIKQIEDQQDY